MLGLHSIIVNNSQQIYVCLLIKKNCHKDVYNTDFIFIKVLLLNYVLGGKGTDVLPTMTIIFRDTS